MIWARNLPVNFSPNSMHTIKKDFGCFPAAHRQPTHPGHCALIHGHDWRFEASISSPVLDVHGFVIDFGNFRPIKEWLIEYFDHTLLLDRNDPMLKQFQNFLGDNNLAKIKVLDSVAAEGIAKMFFHKLEAWLAQVSPRAKLVSVTVHEDWKNSATYEP